MLKAAEYLGKVGVGITCPEFFRAGNGKVYVVKRVENYIGKQVLISELLAAKIGQKLSLPFPPGGIIDLAAFAVPKAVSRLAFASEYIYNAKYATLSQIRQAVNFKEIAGVILFDHFFHNADRTNNHKNLLVAFNETQPFLYGIDHSHLFSAGRWDKGSLFAIAGQVKLYANALYKELLGNYLTRQDFRPHLQKLKALSQADIDRILDGIPPEWLPDADTKNALRHYMLTRRRLIEPIAAAIFNVLV